jgi:hypothetical protein
MFLSFYLMLSNVVAIPTIFFFMKLEQNCTLRRVLPLFLAIFHSLTKIFSQTDALPLFEYTAISSP